MKIVIAGGSGQVGNILARAFIADAHEVVVLSRAGNQKSNWRVTKWDAETLGDWTQEIDGADVVINLAGRSVNCRYTDENRREIMDSRVKSTKIIGEAIANSANPPKVWLQMSTATIYAHRFDAPNDEITGIIGGNEPDAPDTWNFSIEVAKAWEKAAEEIDTPQTRKVLMRAAMIMSPDKNGVFDTLLNLARKSLGGTSGNGRQYVSWIHEDDFVRAVYFLIENENLSGAVNLASPNPLPNKEFMRYLREAWGASFGLPANRLMLEIGAFFMRTETELILKSRRVIPTRLTEAGFKFNFPFWEIASRELCQNWRKDNKFVKLLKAVWIIAMFLTIPASAQWQKQNVDTKASLRGLSVVSGDVVWASGTGGTVLKTVDGGANWTVGKIPGAEKLDFRDVEAFDASTAYVLSIGDGETSRIYKTTDGGDSWKLQFQNKDPKVFLDAFAFWDAKNGIAMGDPVDGKYFLLATNDGGETWKILDSSQMPAAKQGEAAFAASGTCIITQGKKNVFIVSGGNEARVFKSEDRGKSWKVYDTPFVKGTSGSGIFSIAMFDSKKGVIVGGNYEKPAESGNNLAFTKDGGKTWTLGKGLNGYRSGAAFVSRNTLFAVGSNGSDISMDGGKTWKNLDRENYNSVQVMGGIFWAVGANGLVSKDNITVEY